SPTAETIYRNDSRVNVRSAGTGSSARKSINERDIIWADLILVMENKHQKAIAKQYRYLDLPDILVLDIPDDYQYMADELVAMIQISTEDILSRLEEGRI
ncbi:MAG: protein tyrosine phosphatase, partial [Cyanobacteria bacterium J06623_7]